MNLAVAVAVAVAVGAILPRGIATSSTAGGYQNSVCTADDCADPVQAAAHTITARVPVFSRPIPVPLDDLALVGAAALLAVLLAAAIGLLFLRPAADAGQLRAE